MSTNEKNHQHRAFAFVVSPGYSCGQFFASADDNFYSYVDEDKPGFRMTDLLIIQNSPVYISMKGAP